jgi:hypothetical protein
MRNIFLFVANAQDFCNLIKKDVSPGKTIYDYSSPFNEAEPPNVRVTRSYGTDPDYATDNFFLIFQITGDLETIYKKTDTGQIEKDEYKLLVEFDDKSKLTDDTIKVSHDFTNDRIQAIRYVYYPINEASVKSFSSKKIAKFSLAGYEQPVAPDSANAIMHYVQCMKAVK